MVSLNIWNNHFPESFGVSRLLFNFPLTWLPSLLVQPPQRVLICETTKHYRAAALSFAHPSDVVLEVGCHEGECTRTNT